MALHIDPELKRELKEEWLPKLRTLPERRRPIKRALFGFVSLLPCSVVALIVDMWKADTFKTGESVVTGVLTAAVATAFVYLGKIQACDDALLGIECAVYLGDAEHLVKCISELGCYGKFQGALTEGVLRNVGKIAT